MRRLPAEALWYALAILVVVGVPAAAVLLLGTPEPALPSDWSEARARIGDGTFPAGYVVDIGSLVLLLAWGAGLGFLVMALLKRFRRDGGAGDETGVTDVPAAGEEGDPGEPWYRQGPPIFDEPFSDEYTRVVVPPDETTAEDGPQESLWQPAAEAMGESDPLADGMVSDAEIIGGPAGGPDPDEPPMIVPVRAYYFSRDGDTLRSVSAQFLQTPMRWEELRSLNVASPGVAAVEADTLLPPGTALALPGDPLPWGKPDPVYLWTLAEKFLFTAWGREPAPEEVVPFWRGLTGGAQLEAGAPPFQPEHLAAPTEPPASDVEPESVVTEPPMPGEFVTPSPAAAPAEPLAAPTDLQPPPVAQPPYDQPPYESPVPPTHEPVPPTHEPVPPGHEPAYEPVPPPYESPVPPSHEPAYESPVSPTHEPAASQPPPPVTPRTSRLCPQATSRRMSRLYLRATSRRMSRLYLRATSRRMSRLYPQATSRCRLPTSHRCPQATSQRTSRCMGRLCRRRMSRRTSRPYPRHTSPPPSSRRLLSPPRTSRPYPQPTNRPRRWHPNRECRTSGP